MNLKNINELLEEANEEVSRQKKTLANELDNLEDARETNDFLEKIASDYERYRRTLTDQKEQQKKALLGILNYLDEIMETQAVTKFSLEHTKNEQKRLVNEIGKIQKELDEIILT